ncbi:MAG TPA: glycosyltransferase family 39 protein [Candidatus Kapabacteria bacterium]|nr:glycosyltransferase family 39 protein [Candidatus Kapabacteria bacterium]
MLSLKIPKAIVSHRVAIVFLLIATLILPVILLYPFSGDIDIWQWIGTVFVRYGKLPYVAAWDNDFPAIMLVHVTAIYLFGYSMLAFRFVEYVAIFFTLLALYRTSRLWLSKVEALLGCTIFSLYYAYGRMDCMGMKDNFAVLPIVLSCFFFVSASRRASAGRNGSRSTDGLIAAGGAMVGIATCIRPTYMLLLAVPILTLYGITNLRAMILALAGFLIPVLLMLFPFAITPGGLRQAYVCTIRYNTDIYSQFPPSPARLQQFLYNLLELRTIMIFVLVFGWAMINGIHRIRKIHSSVVIGRERSFLLLFFVALLVGMFSQMMNLAASHFAPFYACFILVLTKMLLDNTRWLGRWRPAVLATVLVLVGCVLYPWGLVRSFVKGSFSIESAYRYFPEQFRLAQENENIASYLTRHTNPNEFIEVIGDPGVAWRTARQKSTRFQYEWTFLFTNPKGQVTDFQQEWRAEFLRSLRQTSPHFIIIARERGKTASILFNSSFVQTPEILNFIQQNYALDTLFDQHAIYRRKQAG